MDIEKRDSKSILRSLKERREELVDRLNATRDVLEKIEFSIKVIEDPDSVNRDVKLEISEGGSIKNLKDTIVRYLDSAKEVSTTSDMSDGLYTWQIPLDMRQLKRRLSVTASAMYKNFDNPRIVDSGYKNATREIYWALSEWMNDGVIEEQYLPKQLIKKEPL